MFMSCISILIFCCVNILGAYPAIPGKSIPTPKPTQPIEPIQSPSPPADLTGPCPDGKCRSPPNIVGSIVGAVCGTLVIGLIAVFVVWFCFKRKAQKTLYTGAISTGDSSSKLYGMSPARNDSINSHYYEKINYNERP